MKITKKDIKKAKEIENNLYFKALDKCATQTNFDPMEWLSEKDAEKYYETRNIIKDYKNQHWE